MIEPTFYAQPVARADNGALIEDSPIECRDAMEGILVAELMASTPAYGYIAAWAFAKDASGTRVLKRFVGRLLTDPKE